MTKLLLTTVALFSLSVPSIHGQAKEPLHLVSTTRLPEITGGDFDHFAVDLKHHRLYVVAEVYASIEVFSLPDGKHLDSIRDVVKSPRKIAFVPDKQELLVADAGNASCEILDANDLRHRITSVPLEPGPDAGAYDPRSHIFYVGNGGRAAHQDHSYVTAISIDTNKVLDRVEIPAATIKTIVLDPRGHRIYATMRDKNQVAVVDLARKSVEAVWSNPALHTDSAMTTDLEHHRLFVGNRSPGSLLVMNADTGSASMTLPIGDVSDDMTFDSKHRRVYISSADGLDVIGQDDPDHYRLLQHLDTLGGKTSIYIPSLKRLYVVHTKGGPAPEAGLQIFAVE